MKTATITFPDYPDAFVEVALAPVPVTVYWDFIDTLSDFVPSRAAFLDLAGRFAPYLAAWSFEQPTDAEGLLALDWNLFLAIVQAWMVEVRDAPLPLAVRSSGSAPSKARSRRPSAAPSS